MEKMILTIFKIVACISVVEKIRKLQILLRKLLMLIVLKFN